MSIPLIQEERSVETQEGQRGFLHPWTVQGPGKQRLDHSLANNLEYSSRKKPNALILKPKISEPVVTILQNHVTSMTSPPHPTHQLSCSHWTAQAAATALPQVPWLPAHRKSLLQSKRDPCHVTAATLHL